MKKLVGILIVLAMVLTMLPMAAFAVSNSYDLTVGFNQVIDLDAENQITLVVHAEENDVLLTVDGAGSYYDWYIYDGMRWYYPEINGAYSLKLDAGQVYELTLVSDSFFEDQQLNVSLTAPAVGTESNPDNLVMGESSVDLDGNNAYFYSFTAAEDGKLEIAIDTAKSPDWTYQINVTKSNGTVKYGDTHYSDEDPLVASEDVVVKAGDFVLVSFNTCTWYMPFTVYFNSTFTAGEFEDENEGGEGGGGDIGQIGGGDITVENESVTAAAPWSYSFFTEGPGNLRVIIGECTPGWRYKISYPNGEESLYFTASKWSVGPDYTHELMSAGMYTVSIWAYSDAQYEDVSGSISATLAFTPLDGDLEIPKEEYIVSEILLGLGENSLMLDETAITTIYEFCPEETGLYKFTVGNESALVGYWGAGSFFVQDMTENKTNSLECELTAVGQSIMVGVSGIEGEFSMNIEKVGNAEEIEQIEYIEYVVKSVPLPQYLIDTTDKVVTPIDITKPQTAVKGADGFYHLGSANGPVLYVNLTNDAFDLLQAFYSGYGALTMRGKYTDKDGKDTYYDFLKAMRIYANVLYNSDYDNGLYPMSEDLMIFLKAFGSYQGWYTSEQSSFEAIKGEHNADSAWMVTCVIVTTPSDYRVTGSADWLGNWAADNEAGVMMDLGNGSYQVTYSGVAAGDYELKVTKGGTWDENWGANGANGDNVKFTVGEGQDVTITFNAETVKITVSLSGGDSNPSTGDYTVAALVVAMMAATAGAVVLTKKKEF